MSSNIQSKYIWAFPVFQHAQFLSTYILQWHLIVFFPLPALYLQKQTHTNIWWFWIHLFACQVLIILSKIYWSGLKVMVDDDPFYQKGEISVTSHSWQPLARFCEGFQVTYVVLCPAPYCCWPSIMALKSAQAKICTVSDFLDPGQGFLFKKASKKWTSRSQANDCPQKVR